MEFDSFTVSLLTLRADAPTLDEAALDALQDEHMAHLADLHDQGLLLAAGPLPGADDRHFRGLSIWAPGPDRVRELLAAQPDPVVAAGRFEVTVLPWMVPSGAVRFAHARLPRSMAEARGS
jgi:uncharacterized protein YciI